MSNIAVLSDVHGNVAALDAVLRDAERLGIDSFVLNGDFADGPFPRETLDRLDALGDRAVWLRGNSERWLADAAAGRFFHPDPDTHDITRWAASRVMPERLARLAELPLCFTLPGVDLGFCHATPRSDNEMFLVDASFEHARTAFASLACGSVILGHSHMPFDRLFDRRRLVNAGSVGMPYGHTGAAWVSIVDEQILLRRTDYDAARAAAAIRLSGMPHAAAFADNYVLTTESDAAAMRAFAAIRDRQQAQQMFDTPG